MKTYRKQWGPTDGIVRLRCRISMLWSLAMLGLYPKGFDAFSGGPWPGLHVVVMVHPNGWTWGDRA